MTTETQLDWLSQQPLDRAPFQRHSLTSIAAAESIGDRINALQARVLAYLKAHPSGLTDEQMQAGLGMNPSTQRPRRIELQRKGMLKADGTRKTKAGRSAVVWRAL